MPSEIDSAVFPYLETDLDRVRDVIGPVRFRGRPELTPLTDQGTDTSRRLVRPTLTLLSYYLLTDPSVPADDRVVQAAAAVELLHLGSLYHDDVIDHAYERRGRPSANAVWGSHMAVLGGDSVTMEGTHLLVELGQREALASIVASKQMCAGVVMEAADLYEVSRSEQAYLDSIDGKTAALLSLACRLGAMQAGRSEDHEEALARFGRHFGLAYQLYDDILDLTSTAEEMGKPVNADLPEGIYTLPVIRAAARDRGLARLLRRAMTAEEAARARELVIASGAVQEAQKVADEFIDQAVGQLAGLAVDPRANHAITAYAQSILDRRVARPAVSPQRAQPPQVPDALPPHVRGWLRSWMLDTGLATSAAEADYHRWAGVLHVATQGSLPPADATREQTFHGMAVLAFMWDDLFDDPRLTDPQAVTALRRGLVATLRQDPEKPWRNGAIPTAWASLWPRVRAGRSNDWQERFLDSVEEWFEAAEREAHHRINGYIPSVADYRPLRLSTGGLDIAVAVGEMYLDRELPPKLRRHPVVRRLEEIAFMVNLVENDLMSLDQDDADNAPYNLVRMILHETGCTRREAIEQVECQVVEQRAQLAAVLRYLPGLLRVLPGLSGQGKKYASMYESLAHGSLRGRESSRYKQPFASAAPDLERLRQEIYHPAADPAHTGV
ncbi:polyprenyl synthetase family protein [Nocardia sp. NPDC023852]|uniref:polyprenyl synthetase family protein n=1 Tax=Nocardia sp. NPDC023852 TaxID=3154697 RepID=UPI0033F96930